MFLVTGLGIAIQVSKEGYYQLKESDGTFGYSKAGGQTNPHPDPKSPAIFVLRTMGKPEPLVKIDNYIRVPKNGTPTEVSLTSGNVVANGKGELKVETWTDDQGRPPHSSQPYDWRCRITVSGGGLVKRTGEFDFEAPESGYAPSDEIDMPASLGNQWREHSARQYFLKLSNNRYARVEFEMIAGGDHFFHITSYLNPQPGSRNLEYELSRQAAVR